MVDTAKVTLATRYTFVVEAKDILVSPACNTTPSVAAVAIPVKIDNEPPRAGVVGNVAVV